MKVLIIDQNGENTDLAWRACEDGHQVKRFVAPEKKTSNIGKGMSPIVREYRPFVKWADLIILAWNDTYLNEADSWRKQGIPVIGATQESAKWEIDREYGQKIFKDAGIETIPYKMFTRFDEAIKYVKKENKRFVSKPAGDHADKAMSYVSKSAADMVFMLERWQGLGKLKPPLILQEFIEGVEFGVAGWFGPGGFNRGWEENFEFKKLMNDDLGPNTGEQGSVLRYVARSHLARKVLQPLEEALAATGHTGDIDVNCIIDKDGVPWPLEFTCRFGYPTTFIQNALHQGDSIEWLLKLAEGVDAKNFRMNEISLGVVLAIPDYPYGHIPLSEIEGIPVYGLTDQILEHVHPWQMMLGEAPQEAGGQIVSKPCLVTAGHTVLVTTGTGQTVTEAKKAAYKVLKEISLPNSPMYRTDIGNRLKKQLPILQSLGYATGMQF